jgi:hypothetical protein
MKEQTTKYALGSSDHEIERLDRQSASIEGATRLLLRPATTWSNLLGFLRLKERGQWPS